MMDMGQVKVWIAGHFITECEQSVESYVAWDILGVFSTEERAIKACYNEDCFVGPLYIDEKLPAEIVGWEECYYPFIGEDQE